MDTLTIHYHRYDNQYDNWTLWTWLDEHKTEIKSTGKDDYGLVFNLNVNEYPPKGNINFIPKYKDWKKKDVPDRYWIRTTPTEIWVLQGIETIYFEKPDTKPFIRKAYLDDKKEISVITTKPILKSELKKLNPEVQLTSNKTVKVKSIQLIEKDADSSNSIKLITENILDISDLPGTVFIQPCP